eukprot:3210287-Amphidinium_carterae.2
MQERSYAPTLLCLGMSTTVMSLFLGEQLSCRSIEASMSGTYFIGCHLHAPQDWAGMAFCNCDPEAHLVLIGDLNLASSLRVLTWLTAVQAKALARLVHNISLGIGSEVMLGFSHIHASGKHMSAIDRCFVNLPCSAMLFCRDALSPASFHRSYVGPLQKG